MHIRQFSLLGGFLLVAGTLACLPTLAASPQKSAQKPAPSKATPPAPATPAPTTQSTNPVVQAAAKVGISKCLKRVDQVSSFLTRGTQAGVFIFPTTKDADRHVFSTDFEILAPGTLAYASSSFASAGGNECDAVYEAVTYWPVSCQEAARQGYPQLKSAGVIKQNIQILDGGPAMRVFLMPAGAGCVSIKKELVL
jgi:hypothetical protein